MIFKHKVVKHAAMLCRAYNIGKTINIALIQLSPQQLAESRVLNVSVHESI